MTAKPIQIKTLGRYRTRDNRVATVHRTDLGRAFGCVDNFKDGTWWYRNGEHALCPIEDLIALAEPDNDDAVRKRRRAP